MSSSVEERENNICCECVTDGLKNDWGQSAASWYISIIQVWKKKSCSSPASLSSDSTLAAQVMPKLIAVLSQREKMVFTPVSGFHYFQIGELKTLVNTGGSLSEQENPYHSKENTAWNSVFSSSGAAVVCCRWCRVHVDKMLRQVTRVAELVKITKDVQV